LLFMDVFMAMRARYGCFWMSSGQSKLRRASQASLLSRSQSAGSVLVPTDDAAFEPSNCLYR